MTQSELRYLIAVQFLDRDGNGVKLTDIAEKAKVTKVSVYRAVERLEKNGYICRNERNKVVLTEEGKKSLAIYQAVVSHMQTHLETYFSISSEEAYEDALGVACALGISSREAIYRMAQES